MSDASENIPDVATHPILFRHLDERFGLIEADDPLAQRTVNLRPRHRSGRRPSSAIGGDWAIGMTSALPARFPSLWASFAGLQTP